MQATSCTVSYPYTIRVPEKAAQYTALSSFAFLAGLLLLASSSHEAGEVPGKEIVPIEDNQSDLTLSQVVERIALYLPASHKHEAYGLGRLVLELSDRHQFSPALILAVIEMESGYRFTVVSKAGAIGLMQLLPETAKEVALRYQIHSFHKTEDLRNPAINLRLGVAYLAQLRRQFGHSLFYLAAYNRGPTALSKRIRSGQYDLGSMDHYVRSIHERARLLRGGHQGVKLPGIRREEALMAASL